MLLVLSGCAGSLERGTFVRSEWPEMELRAASDRRGLVAMQGEVLIVEGDASLISGIGSAYGIRFDEERNDLGAITARIGEQLDEPAVLVLFTTFDDRGAGGPAYYVPIYNEVTGTGMGAIDQRADFGVSAFFGVANLKLRESHGDRILASASHELAHRHLAYFPSLAASSTVVDILGRQRAHWHAMLHTDGSLLGGHELRPAGNGFVVVARNVRMSELDLYGLGLFAAEEVRPFFFIGDARNENGSLIPPAAELEAGARISGVRIDLTIEDVVRAAGPRDPGEAELRAVFALVTRPNEAATSTSVRAEAEAIDALRSDLEAAWSSFTRSRGSLCTSLAGCLVPETPDAGMTIVEKGGDCGCAAVLRGEGAGHGATERFVSLAPALLLAILSVRLRCRARGPSCDRFPSSASPRRPGSPPPSH